MFRGNWNRDRAPVIVAIVGAAITVALYWAMFYNAGYSAGRHEQRAYEASERYPRDAAEHIKQECGTGIAAERTKCVREIIEAEREAERNESDLAAQWKAADWVLWAGVLAAAQLLISGVGLFALLETIKQGRAALKRARKANKIAADTAERTLRAYVNITDARVEGYDGREIPRFSCKIKNFGQTPANEVRMIAAIFYENEMAGGKKPYRFSREHRWFVRQTKGFSLAPGEEREIFYRPPRAPGQSRLSRDMEGAVYAGAMSYKDFLGRTRRAVFKLKVAENYCVGGNGPLVHHMTGNRAN